MNVRRRHCQSVQTHAALDNDGLYGFHDDSLELSIKPCRLMSRVRPPPVCQPLVGFLKSLATLNISSGMVLAPGAICVRSK